MKVTWGEPFPPASAQTDRQTDRGRSFWSSQPINILNSPLRGLEGIWRRLVGDEDAHRKSRGGLDVQKRSRVDLELV